MSAHDESDDSQRYRAAHVWRCSMALSKARLNSNRSTLDHMALPITPDHLAEVWALTAGGGLYIHPLGTDSEQSPNALGRAEAPLAGDSQS
jgi:hypothetical protein